MIFLLHPAAFVALGVLVLGWAAIMMGWLVVSALWDVLLLGAALAALSLPFAWWGVGRSAPHRRDAGIL